MENEYIKLSTNKLNIFVAYTDKDKYIGYKNDLPWKRDLRGDMNFLKLQLKQDPNIVVIMGRKTFESIPVKIHKNIIVITRNENLKEKDVLVFNKFDKSIEYCREKNLKPIICGGSEIYKEALKYPFKLFYTIVNQSNLVGDICFKNEKELNGKNITLEVEKYLLLKNIKKSWELVDNHFIENNHKYAFYITEQ